MTGGQAAKQARTKLTLEQLEHLTKHHLKFEVQEGMVIIYYVISCDKKGCFGGDAVTVQICPSPPCPRPVT